ncbi:MAG: DUF4856 domain-containing protein [Flavobacteriales bacterium]
MKLLYYTLLAVTCLVSGCKKTITDPQPSLPLQTTYSFSNVNYSGQTTRIDMLEEMAVYMKTANTTGTSISATVLKNMYANLGSPFSDMNLNNSGKQLKNKTYALDIPMFEAYMDSIDFASQSMAAGSNGVAGVVTSPSNPTKKYLCGANGVEYMQLIEKGLMGAVFAYQVTDYYLSPSQIGNSVDNATVLPGEGTPMEHHWDEAFGYFGCPIDFPTNTTGIVYWAKYSNTVNPPLNCNNNMMRAFIAGRGAISGHNYAARDAKAEILRKGWDEICAATTIHYLNEALANYGDDAVRNHSLSEGIAFAMSLKYNPLKKISASDHQLLLSYFGSNFYTISVSSINNAKNLLGSIYGFELIQNAL